MPDARPVSKKTGEPLPRNARELLKDYKDLRRQLKEDEQNHRAQK